MDKDLLNALQNIGDQLDMLSQILSQKKDTISDIATVLSSGDFSEQLKSISIEIKSVKTDTQQILKNQQTILAMSKENEKEKIGAFDESGKQESNLKKGVVVILGIATAVLAIGFAFKLVGDVNVAAVLSLTVAIAVMALAFERLAESKLTIANVLLASGVMISMSVGILASSYILSGVSDVTEDKLLTSIGIAGAFSLISLSIGKLLSGIKDIKATDVLPLTLAMIFIFPAISIGIALSSYVLNMVTAVSPMKVLTAILIGGLFAVLSYSVKNIVAGLKDIKTDDAITVGFNAPILFVGLSFAIAGSSLALSMVQQITFTQFITSLGISILFIALSYAVKPIVSATKGLKLQDIIILPLLFTTLSYAIAYSSKYLKETEQIEFMKILNIVALGVGLAIMVAAMAIPIRLLANVGLPQIFKGSAAIVVIAGAIAASSQLLSMGDYSNSPDVGWALGTGLALAAFGVSAGVLGLLVFGPQALIFAAGLVAILGVAGTIVAVSKILKEGDYNIPNMLDWSIGVSLALGAFSLGMVYLGGLIVGTLGIGAGVLLAGSLAIAGVAKTIVSVSNILADGYTDDKGVKIKPNYKPGPTKAWAEGISIAIGAFSPIYQMLKNNAILSIFGGGVSPKDFNEAIITVSKGIVAAANFFNSNGVKWGDYPTKEWSEGVGLAISSFAPVYKILKENSGWFSSGINPSDFAGTFDENGKLIKDGAIQIISRGIVSAARFFSENTAPFDEGKYPSENWSKGVGGALVAFAPVYEVLMNKGFFTSGKKAIDEMTYGITSITNSIVATAKKFAGVAWDNFPKTIWVDNVSNVINKYISLLDRLAKLENINYGVGTRIASRMVSFAKIIASGREAFSTTINPNFIQNMSKNILDFDSLVKDIIKNRNDDTISFNIFAKDPVLEIAENMTTLAKGYDKLASSLTNLGSSMKTLNVDSLRSLALLTNVMVNPNISIPTTELEKQMGQVNMVNTTVQAGPSEVKTNSPLEEKIQTMIELLAGIQSNTISLDQIIQMMSEERIKKYEID